MPTVEPESRNAADSLGQTLERARARSGLSRLQAAERLRLEPRIIEALETERFELIGPAVYVRGHLRHYGELLGEDVGALERLYAQLDNSAAAPDVSRIVAEPLPQAPQAPALGVWSAGGVAGLLVVVGLVWWAMRTAPPAVEQQVVAAEPTVAPPAAALAPTAAAPVAPAVTPRAGNSTAPVAAPSAAPTPTAANRARVTISFLADSWTEVYDANGQRLYYGTGRAGSVQTLQGQAPLRVVLGNVAGVVMDLNGRRVSLPADLLGGEKVDLSLDAAGQVARRATESNPGVP